MGGGGIIKLQFLYMLYFNLFLYLKIQIIKGNQVC